MHLDDMLSNQEILVIILFIKDHKEDVESRHYRRRNVDVESQRLGPVISTEDWIGCSQY